MKDTLEVFKRLLADEDEFDMYITGPAGTGKTTDLARLVAYCEQSDIPYIVVAYTHKACDVLRQKLPANANISTLHSWLRKRPTINPNALKIHEVERNSKMGDSERVRVVFIDEYSIVGDRDLVDIRTEQDNPETEETEIKVVWLGDKNQLPPVGDVEAIEPEGPYQVKLTKVHRQGKDNPLLDTLITLVKFIEGRLKPHALEPNASFVRGVDLISTYKSLEGSKVMLAFTNKRVQELNAFAAGKQLAEPGDIVFSPTTKHYYILDSFVPASSVTAIDSPFKPGATLTLNSKYKTLEFLIESGYSFARLDDLETGQTVVLPYIFGHYDFKLAAEQLKHHAVSANNAIESKHKVKAAAWSAANAGSPLARDRGLAWKSFLSFNQNVVCLDFAHAMTVHKSQGSTFDYVVADTEDIGFCSDSNFKLYLRLMYVALSRAAKKVYTN